MGFWLSPAVSTRDPTIKPESFSSRVDNGRRLILMAMTKTPCYNLFITYSNPLFLDNSSTFIPKQRNSAMKSAYHPAILFAWRHTKRRAQMLHPGMITSPRSKYMISGHQPGLITKGRETRYHINRLLVIASNILPNMWYYLRFFRCNWKICQSLFSHKSVDSNIL